MGMAASQMRYCLLVGRKSDVEFEGQQINQQRTTLATETSAYNSQLLNLTVPTPPSSDQFTKMTYSFVTNGETRTVTGTIFKPNDYTFEGEDYEGPSFIVNYTTNRTFPQGKSSGVSRFTSTTNGGVITYRNSNGNALDICVIDPAAAGYSPTDEDNLSLIIQNCDIRDVNGLPYNDPDYIMPTFYKYTSNGVTKYVNLADLQDSIDPDTGLPTADISTYYVDENATSAEGHTMAGAQVHWNESNRMTEIIDKDGNVLPVSVSSSNDDAAFKDALNEYEYKKSLYEHEIEGVNAKIQILQGQDKNLELKLRELDSRQKQLDTEMDAVKKVGDKNVETSYKTFA